ncbi:thiol reductase thioredoxin [Chlorella sorokiniana]|uniref:Thiol reductase thioredoxin n=1 Tax=Chlorella sorokiniana TaxID=3076 RepID=A0A2P6THP9_CHLSO|nr:thiol reductase thioredoxin [Chlorella sorokiniana]|eukprot:PRW33807.1 thiol reductase thioredoxin [Chlorella sorokiniana]
MRAIAPAWKDRVRFEKIDTEEHPAVADAYQVHKLPTLILFRGGQPVDRYEGLLSGQDLDMRLRANMMK